MSSPRVNKPHTPISGALFVARPIIAAMMPGETVLIELPDGPFSRLETARRIGSMARTLWGKGAATVVTRRNPTHATVTRKDNPNV